MHKDETKKAWASLKVTHVGHVAEVVKGGGGKLSTAGGDPGEARKQTGNDGA
jgi:hypothetical protein